MPVRFTVSGSKRAQLEARMRLNEIAEDDLEEQFVRGSGPGGQKINKTSICVILKHIPTGTEVRCQQSRSQALNRYYARLELCDRVEEKREGVLAAKQQKIEKERRRKRKRGKRQKEKMLADKSRRAKTKTMRSRVRGDD
jgi:peptide chain release factor